MSRQHSITVLGDGGWGTTLAIILCKKGYDVCLWSAFADYATLLDKKRVNEKFLKGIKIPREICITSHLEEACNFSDTIILAIPSQHLRSVLCKVQRYSMKHKKFLSAVKGIEVNSLMRMSEVIVDELGKIELAVISGPNIAHEIAEGKPAASVVASHNEAISLYFQNLLMSETLRIYTNNDVIGVELGGSLKNIIALACGFIDGLGLGTNAQAGLMTRGLAEMSRLGHALGAQRQTFFGISGLGDLITTCMSPYSRNRFVGEEIARGKSLRHIQTKMKMVAEGVPTAKATYALAKKLNVEMPITMEIYSVLYHNKSARQAVKDLMLRKRKAELL